MITLVYAYYNNSKMLDLQLQEWSKYQDKDKWQAIIVDDGSQRDPAIDHLIDVGFPISLYRIKNDIPWNMDGARNLAMTHASGWCLLCDMDHVLTADKAKELQGLALNAGRAYKFQRRLTNGTKINQGANIWIMHADLFWKIGGYDERYAGYYGSDLYFKKSADAVAGKPIELDIELTVYMPAQVKDASTTDYGRLNSKHDLRKLKKELAPVPQLNFEWERLA